MYRTYVLNEEEIKKFSQLTDLKCDKVILSKEKDSYYATVFSSTDTTIRVSKELALKFMR